MLLQLGVMTYSDVSKQSPETQAAIEQEVRILLKVGAEGRTAASLANIDSGSLTDFCFIQDSYDRAKSILKKYSEEHKKLADALLRYETLDAKEIQMVLEGKPLDH